MGVEDFNLMSHQGWESVAASLTGYGQLPTYITRLGSAIHNQISHETVERALGSLQREADSEFGTGWESSKLADDVVQRETVKTVIGRVERFLKTPALV